MTMLSVQEAVIETPASELDRQRISREGKLWLLAAILMLATGVFKGINLLVLLAYLLLAAWVMNWWFARRGLRRLRGKRIAGNPPIAGEPSERVIEITCQASSGVRGWLVEEVGTNFAIHWFVLEIAGGSALVLRRNFVLPRRGRYRVEPLRVSTQYPFGLVRASVELAPAEDIVVLPRLGIIQIERLKHWIARSVRGDGRSRRQVRRASPQEADLHGLREFRTGDSPRWIHWRSSARRNQLLVREFEDNAPPNLVLAIEPWLPAKATEQQQERLEWVISLAATICREWCRESGGRLVLAIARPTPVILTGATTSEHAIRTIESLAIQEGAPTVPVAAWFDKLGPSVVTVPVLALSSRDATAFASSISELLGRAVASLEPGEGVDWFQPPLQPMGRHD